MDQPGKDLVSMVAQQDARLFPRMAQDTKGFPLFFSGGGGGGGGEGVAIMSCRIIFGKRPRTSLIKHRATKESSHAIFFHELSSFL